MYITLIHNPGAGEGNPSADELREAFAAAGHTVRYLSTREHDWAAGLAHPADLMVAAGGDGTFGKVAAATPDRRVPITIIPLGTANNIALTLGLAADWRAAIAGLEGGTRRRFDCGIARGPWGATSFIESAGAGMVSHLIAAADTTEVEEALERAPIPDRFDDLRRLAALLLGEMHACDYSIEADGADLSGRYVLVEAMNIRSIGPRLRLAPGAVPDDALLDLVLIDEAAQERFAEDVESWLDGWTQNTPWPVRRVGRVRIAGEGMAWHADDNLLPDAQKAPVPVTGTIQAEIAASVELLLPATAGLTAPGPR